MAAAAPSLMAEVLVISESYKKQHASAAAEDDQQEEGCFLIGTASAADAARQQFSPSMVSQGLSQLGRSASGAHQVYQKLELTHTTLDDPRRVAHCEHVQQLVLARNCLTTLQPLSQLQHLTSLDASHNRLTTVVDSHSGHSSSSSSLRKVDLSFNQIDSIGDLRHHSNLCELRLRGNRLLQGLGRALEPLQRLRLLDLGANGINSCQGLQGLSSLVLLLDRNRISSLQPLAGLSGLQVLAAAHNRISSLAGVEALTSLRRLDVAGNQLRRVEALAACRANNLLTCLDVSGNPLEAAQDARLHIVNLLTQLQTLNAREVTVMDKVDAANMVGGATDRLVQIRRQFFPAGELPDGGGAVPPTAAGLHASQAEEERSCSDAAAMFDAVDRWAASVQPALALQPAVSAAPTGITAAAHTTSLPLAAQPSASSSSSSSRRTSAACSTAGSLLVSRSRPGSHTGARPQRQPSANLRAPGGIAAIAARLAAGCCPEGPCRQLQLLRVCHAWVLAHVQLPRDCSIDAGVDLVTWDVGRPLFGEGQQHLRLQEVLLPGQSGTWAECVTQLLVSLLRACHMEAQQLSGFWKAGGAESGQQLASHNHSWVAAKVNGKWRLLDPVQALISARHDQPLPFFLAPEALIHTHLPFEPCWQLLPEPVRGSDWWQRPGLSLAFAAAGGRLLDGEVPLSACNVLRVHRDALLLPTLRVSLAAPASSQQQLHISVLDATRQPLPAVTHQPEQAEPLVFKQHVLGAAGQLQAAVGPADVQLEVQELWAAFPGPGTFFVQVEQVTEVPGGLMPALSIDGLAQPLSLALRQQQEVLQHKVVVQAAQAEAQWDGADVGLQHNSTPAVGFLPQCIQPSSCSLQLIAPQPGSYLEADRAQEFVVVGPAGSPVAVGSEQSGWVVLQEQHQQQQCEEGACQWATFRGSLTLPRVPMCYMAVDAGGCGSSSSSAGWVPVLGLHVWPPVQTLVAVAEPAAEQAAADPASLAQAGSAAAAAAATLLAALDVDGDGAAGRKDMLLAFRRDRQLADHLKMPARIRAGPSGSSTFDVFLARFSLINSSGLGYVSAQELSHYLAGLAAGGGGSSSRHCVATAAGGSRLPTAQPPLS